MPHPERSGCGNTVCRLHRRQAELYGHNLGDKEPLAEIVDAGRKTKIAKVAKLRVAFLLNSLIINMSYYIHDVTPKVVAIAVRIVIAMWMIFFQISCLFMFS